MALTIHGTDGIETNTDTGKLKVGTGDDLQIYHDGSHSYVDNTGTGNLYLKDAGAVKVRTASFGVDNADGSEAMISAAADGSVDLYYDNAKQFETVSGGCQFVNDVKFDNNTTGGADAFWDSSAGEFMHYDNVKASWGNSSDLQIYHNGSNSYIKNSGTGNLFVDIAESSKFDVHHDGETIFAGYADGRFEAMYDGAVKIVTTGSGITVYGSVSTADLNLSNLDHTTPNEVDNTKGSWSMQEGANDLFLINRTNGKKYKFNLTEVVS